MNTAEAVVETEGHALLSTTLGLAPLLGLFFPMLALIWSEPSGESRPDRDDG